MSKPAAHMTVVSRTHRTHADPSRRRRCRRRCRCPGNALTIIKGEATVLIGNMPAARLTDTTVPCCRLRARRNFSTVMR